MNFGIPSDSLPRLVVWAGRTKAAVDKVFDSLETVPLDAEMVGLLHGIQKYEHPGNLYRGYTILDKNDADDNKTAKCRSRVTEHSDIVKRPIVWVFTGMGSQWTGMGKSLMQIDIFRETMHQCHEILKPYGLDLLSIVTSTDESTFDNIVNSFVGIAAIQIALVDVLRALQMPFDYCIGHSVGELGKIIHYYCFQTVYRCQFVFFSLDECTKQCHIGCAYADGTLTAKQMLLAAYARGVVSVETKCVVGAMAAVGISYDELKDMVPEGIEVACHNSSNSSTISGTKESIGKFVDELKAKKIFAKEVACSNIPYHSKYIAAMGPKLCAQLKEFIPEPKRRTEKWISSSIPKEEWSQEKSQFSSAEYHTNNLLSPVLFEEASKHLPEDAITIEIAPHGLLQAIIKKCWPKGVHVPLTHRGNKENAIFFLASIGK